MHVAIIGAGSVGTQLAHRFTQAGHTVTFGLRDPSNPGDLLDPFPKGLAHVATNADAVAAADLTLLSVPAKALGDVAASVPDWTGKRVIDCTNPVGWDNGPVPMELPAPSGAEWFAAQATGARVIKGLNTFGAEFHGDPSRLGQPITTFLCGDHDDDLKDVAGLLTDLGFDPVLSGPLRNAKVLEHTAILWIHLALKGGLGRSIALQLLREG